MSGGTVPLVAALMFGLMALGTAPALAQQSPPEQDENRAPVLVPHKKTQGVQYYLEHPEAPISPELKRRLPDERLARLQKRRKRLRENGLKASPRRSALAKDIGGFPDFTQDQSWALTENPNPALNFDVTGTPQFAGDVNGDGTNDYVYTDPSARDERTAQLEDRAGKTALYFGGIPPKEPDQLLYTEPGRGLQPAGDLNGDGNDDAIAIERFGNEVRIYTGDSTGYTAARDVAARFGADQSVGFTDLDGDGYEDVVIHDNGGLFQVIYGADDVSRIEVRVYEPGRDFPDPEAFRFTYNAADLEGDGQGEIVRLAGEPPNIKVQTFEVSDSIRSITQTQSFAAGELDFVAGADRANLSLIDITGNDTLEIAAKDEFSGAKTYVFERNTDSTYAETPDSLEKDDAVPVGDLDGDGNHDFFTFDGSTDTRYVSYGPDNLSDGLTFDTEIPYGENVSGGAGFLPQGGLGDVTGNGRPDVGLGLSDNSNETVGRRFFSVDSNRNALSPEDVSYPESRFFDRVLSAQEIGDFNGDGTDDFALVRFDVGQIEVFYGGAPISQTPDLTIEAPAGENYVSVSSGDFNGDGTDDIAANTNGGGTIDIFLGGEGADGQVDHTISASDLEISTLYYMHSIGDVNDNGADDLLASNLGGPDSLAVFFGGPTLPSTPDATIQYDGSSGAGETLAAPGDVNGDGVDDFVVGRPDFQKGGSRTGRADVYFGGSDPSFSSPNLELLPDTTAGNVSNFSSGLAGGDFDGDGNGDIAARPRSAEVGVSIAIFEGGPNFDDVADQRLVVPPETGLGQDFDGDGTVDDLGRGVLEAIPLSGPSDGLVQGTERFSSSTNAVLYRPLAGSSEPAAVFRAPNQDASLGGFSNVFGGIAGGDFTGSGRPDVVFPQTRDNNDAAQSSRVYRYEVQGIPVAAATEFVSANGPAFDSTAVLGLSIDFANISGEDSVSARKYLNAPVNASGLDREAVVARYTVESGPGLTFGAGTTVRFDTGALNAQSPGNLVVYKRSTPDEGTFSGLETTYDEETGTLSAPVESLGEFVLATAPDSVTVWAGDTDNDGTVDQADVLPLGRYWDKSGPARSETGCDWTGDRVAPWTPEAATYADANGDGVVNQDDVLCLGLNWGETRSTSSSSVLAGKSGESAGELALRRAEESGRAIWVELHARELESLMGVATELSFDPEVVSVEAVEPGGRMGEDPLLQSSTDEARGTLGLGISRKGAASKAAGDRPVARIKLRSEVEDPEVSLREGQATTAKGRSVSLATDEGLEALPEEVTLEAPVPNPARQRATLRYALPEAQQVRLTVYDVLGREVAVLVDRKQQAGEKQVSLDASQLSSGTYFYRLEADGATMTERLTIVR